MTPEFKPDDATRRQIEAADPRGSTWLSANAGSGKTRVLTDRVARLLLAGTPPERILCLTYTKAAAAEMQNRLFARLGAWAMQDDMTLRAELRQLGEDSALDTGLLSRARRLFAQAIETPGGLKVQTIHAFCAALLRRFPLEAGVSPGFTEMDDRAAGRLTEEVLDQMAEGEDQDAIDAVAPLVSGDDGLLALAEAVLDNREAITDTLPDIHSWFGVPQDESVARIIAETVEPADAAILTALTGATGAHPGPTDGKLIAELGCVDFTAPKPDDLLILERALLSGSGAKEPFSSKAGKIPTKAPRAAMGTGADALDDLCRRVEVARKRRIGLEAARRTEALHMFARALLPRIAAAKATRGWLDFDDLITRTRHLLTDPSVAQWVLFRLDGGIDHILVDEAQDTSPAQWDIIRQLSAEFASGVGARADIQRTIFVVGDKKQSIYSFQGADPEGFDRMRDHFRTSLQEVASPFQSLDLQYSFRSAAPILALVDHIFDGPAGQGIGPSPSHLAFKSDMAGRVDLWPVVPEVEMPEPADWPRPVDTIPPEHHTVLLARRIVDAIRVMIRDEVPIGPPGKRRPVSAGDILILVQRRSGLYHPLAAAIKASGLPFAGADRMRIAAELAVSDLTSLLRFLATPDDDLALAEALRSPLFGWTEAELYALAQPRGGKTLWQALRQHDGPTRDILRDLRDQADFLRPYDLIERILIRHDGRRRLLQRLGPEAEEGIDAMLAQALAYERIEVPSLLGFTGWLASGEVEIKRTLTGDEGVIRLMTVHGAKGLEAPVVILPDTAAPRGGGARLSLLTPEDGPLIWPPLAAARPEAVTALADARKAAEADERRRLLYVALTRAENWLIVAGCGKIGDDPATSWYRATEGALQEMGAAPHGFEDWGDGLRYQTGDWVPAPPPRDDRSTTVRLPDWASRPATPPAAGIQVRSPSDLGGAKALPGDSVTLDEAASLARGRRIHLLLEHLPVLPRERWADAAPGLLAPDGEVTAGEAADLLAEARAVLEAPELAHLFSPDALAEVSLAGHSPTLDAPLAGQIDRLIVAPDHVLAIDFKSNAIVPDNPDDIPEGLLRQMGAYGELLGLVYPNHRIETALLWTRTTTLMPVPPVLACTALARAALP